MTWQSAGPSESKVQMHEEHPNASERRERSMHELLVTGIHRCRHEGSQHLVSSVFHVLWVLPDAHLQKGLGEVEVQQKQPQTRAKVVESSSRPDSVSNNGET